MKAIVYTEYGPPEVLQVQEVERPVPSKGEVLIRVHAAEATKADCELRSFKFPVKWFWLPLRLALGIRRPRRQILGAYFSGVIDSLGDGVTRLEDGQAVFGSTGLRVGAYGEYVVLPEKATLADKPRNLSFEEAAAVPLGALNALHFLRRAKVQPGEHVLVNGAGGSIGIFGVQIAKSMGAEVTAVDCAAKEAMIRDIGADHFIDYEQEDFTRLGRSYDVIFDMVVKSSYARCLRSLKPKGRYALANPRFINLLRAYPTSWFSDKDVIVALARETVEELRDIKDAIERGEIRVPLDRVVPLEEAVLAHQLVESEQRVGMVVISHGRDEEAGG